MGYLALYRKYRPSGFDGVIGQDHIIQTLVNQIKYNRLGHAYLFTGTRGTGKTSILDIGLRMRMHRIGGRQRSAYFGMRGVDVGIPLFLI